jgi:hypothetical protein
VEWETVLAGLCPMDLYQRVFEVLLEICRKYVPSRRTRRTNKIPRDRRIVMRKRAKLRKRIVLMPMCRERETLTRRVDALELELMESHDRER